MRSNLEFTSFEENRIAERKIKFEKNKNEIISSLKTNLKELNLIFRENFSVKEFSIPVKQEIKKIKALLNNENNNFVIEVGKNVLEQSSKIIKVVSNKINKSKLLEDNLNLYKIELNAILRSNFGTDKAKSASNLIKKIESALTVLEKESLNNKIEIFLRKNKPKDKIKNKIQTAKSSSKAVPNEKKQKEILKTTNKIPKSIDTFDNPKGQNEFLKIVKNTQNSAVNAKNDMQMGGFLNTRSKQLCNLLGPMNFKIDGWIGTINDVDSTSDGKGVLSIKVGKDIFIETWNNAFSDFVAKTLIEPNSSVFNAAANMSKGDKVKFSGNFVTHDTHCIDEQSISLSGKVREPEFTFKFVEIAK